MSLHPVDIVAEHRIRGNPSYYSSPKASTTDWLAEAGGTPVARVRALGARISDATGKKSPSLVGQGSGSFSVGLRAEAVATS